MDKIYGVSFVDGGKVYYFRSKIICPINVTVIIQTEKGEQFGKIICEIAQENNKYEGLKDVIRIATSEDYQQHLQNLKDADRALKKCQELKDQLGLKMKVISANFTFDKNQLLFNFLADDRVDFRELARKLASIYRTRIELRQIGPRDKAKEISGIGVCGQKLCCANFLNQLETVSINMAKNQNLALNPTKINGACNRLLCCLAYEDDDYVEARKGMPQVGSRVKTPKGTGEVTDINVLNRKYNVLVNDEKIEICLDNDKNSIK